MATIQFDVPECGRFEYNSLTNYITKIKTENSQGQTKQKDCELTSIVWGKSFEEYKKEMNHNLRSLVLQVTRYCNLRCDYCAYSGSFTNMLPHAEKNMSLEVMCQSINFFMQHSDNSEDLVIIFYGGEPLTEFENIVKAVNYAKRFNRNIRFGISSNGVLVNQRVIKWLSENSDVYLTVTINGKKHDLYRRKIDGSGSFKIIFDNLIKIKTSYPDIWQNQIRLISNINSMEEINDLRDFYLKKMKKIPSMISKLNFDFCDESVRKKYFVDQEKENTLLEKFADDYVRTNDPFLSVLYDKGIDMIHNRGLCGENTPGYIGSCMPLSWRLFVRVDGTFNMCEKVTDKLNLGDIKNGYNYTTIEYLYNQLLNFSNNKCRKCWAQRLCLFCFQDFLDENGKLPMSFSEEKCKKMRDDIIFYLKMYIQIISQDPNRLN